MRLLTRRALPDYSLCDQTATLYHRDGSGVVTRTVLESVFFDGERTGDVTKLGAEGKSTFLLVIPGASCPVQIGDKVVRGYGVQVTPAFDWARFIPSLVPGLVIVRSVDRKLWRGAVVHTEARG